MEEMILCQSCGDLLMNKKMLGTNADGSKSKDYCLYCYQNGVFTQDLTVNDMIEQNLAKLEGQTNAPLRELRYQLEHSVPALKRWR